MKWLRSIGVDDCRWRRAAVDRETLLRASTIVDDVRERGETALRDHAERLGDVAPGEPLIRDTGDLRAAAAALCAADRDLIARTADRIRRFAEAQRHAITPLDTAIPGGRAGHTLAPVARAGCYAPGGRYPLPSSVLMTAVTARAAGVTSVWVASPRPSAVTLAAAAEAGADGVLAAGGAQAIAALAFGAGPVPSCDVVVGPGNRWVTAAKRLVAGDVGIDMLAGPSELVVLADDSTPADLVAADLLAQAEHDPDAVPILVTPSARLAEAVDEAIGQQLTGLSTASVAVQALTNGGVLLVQTLEAGVAACNLLAPEHLEVLVADPERLAPSLEHYGALFLGSQAAEVLGDYGAGPNHVLPTGGTARFAGGLSVLTFLRVRTWMQIDDLQAAAPLVADAIRLARLEGLEAHARAAAMRVAPTKRRPPTR